MKTAKCGCLYEGAVQMCKLHTGAPALLEALEAMINATHASADSSYRVIVRDKARAAIRAAKGESK